MKPRNSKNNKGQTHSASRSATQQPALWSILLRAVGVGMGTVICVVVLLGASGQDDSSEGVNRKKIESMSSSERARLKRNYEKFGKLSPQEKQRFRQIHNATRNQPELDQVMRSYCNWVKTLSPWEQEDLRKAKTLQERMALIQKLRSQNIEEKHRGSRSDYEVLRMLKFEGRFTRVIYLPIPPPPTAIYNEVLKMLEQSLPRPVKYPRPKESLSEFERSLAVLKMVGAEKQENERGSSWPPVEVLDNIYQFLADKKYSFRHSGPQRNGRLFPPPEENIRRPDENKRRTMLSVFLTKGLVNQLVKTVKQELDQQTPSDEKLQVFFETELDTKAKDKLMVNSPAEMHELLKYRYLKNNLSIDVSKKINSQTAKVNAIIPLLFRGVEPKAFFQLFQPKKGDKDRESDMKRRRSGGPRGLGERFDRNQKPLRKQGKRPGA